MSKESKQIPAQVPEKQVRDTWEKIWPKKTELNPHYNLNIDNGKIITKTPLSVESLAAVIKAVK